MWGEAGLCVGLSCQNTFYSKQWKILSHNIEQYLGVLQRANCHAYSWYRFKYAWKTVRYFILIIHSSLSCIDYYAL